MHALRNTSLVVIALLFLVLSAQAAPTVGTLVPASGPVGTQVQINGTGFGATQGTSTVTFYYNQTATVVSWSDTQITVTVPSTAATGGVKVTVGGVSSNTNVGFLVPSPHVDSIDPTSGVVGTQITINGTGFQATKGNGVASINNASLSVVSWSDTQIVARAWSDARTGAVKVRANNGQLSNADVIFTLPNPQISTLVPNSAPVGTQVQINGSGFGATQGSSTVAFYSGRNATVVSWSDTQITAVVPILAVTGAVTVTVGGIPSNTNVNFTVPLPHIDSISPTSGVVGTQLTIYGTGFQQAKGDGVVTIGNSNCPIISWSDTQIVLTVGATGTSPVMVTTTSGLQSNRNVIFTMPNPRVSTLVPASGSAGTQVQINGTGFGASQATSTVYFNGQAATVQNWSDLQITATVPSLATTGAVTVREGGVTSNTNVSFTVVPPHIDSLSPTYGGVGTQVTINGTAFQPTRGNGGVYFGNLGAAIVSWSDTQVVATVPSGAKTSAVKVLANNNLSSNTDVIFTMPNPQISTLVPNSGLPGTQVQINGTGFGATQDTSTVTFYNGRVATVVAWSDTQITAIVPSLALTGGVRVIVGGVSNTTVNFTVLPPHIDSITPAVGGVGNSVTIIGTGFQSTPGSGIVTINSQSLALVSWSDTQIVGTVHPNVTTGPVKVTANNGLQSNTVTYTVPDLKVTSLSPASGPVGTQVSINGNSFGATQGTSTVTFNGSPATVNSWSNTLISATVPDTAITGPVQVTVGGVLSNKTVNFTVPAPVVSTLAPYGGGIGIPVTITGTGFQNNQRTSVVTFNGIPASVSSWSDTSIVATVPTAATTGPVVVAVNGVSSNNNVSFFVPNTIISGLSPAYGAPGGTIRINGSGFGAYPNGQITLNGAVLDSGYYKMWSDSQITITIPPTASTGPVVVTRAGVPSNGVQLTVAGPPTITSIFPTRGPIGTSVTVFGTGFGPQGSGTVDFYGILVEPTSWTESSITLTVPDRAISGNIGVHIAGLNAHTGKFTVSREVHVTDSANNQTIYSFDSNGGMWTNTQSQGPGCSSCTVRRENLRTYDSQGNMLTDSDALGHAITSTYNGFGQRLTQSQSVGTSTATTSYTYNSFGQVLTTTDPLGHTTTNQYDSKGNLTRITTPAPDGNTAASVIQFAYDSKGQLMTITDPVGNVTTMTYTPEGLISTISDTQQHVTTYEYDSHFNRSAIIDAANHRTEFTYDVGNRLTQIKYPDDTTSSFGYDYRGRRTTVTDQNNKTTTYVYDDADRMTEVHDAAGNVTAYGYDSENNLINITDPNGYQTSFTYDAYGQLTQTVFPSNLSESYIYDNSGRLTSKTDRKGETISYVYDALNRLTQKIYPDQTHVDYVYDLVGRIMSVNDPTGNYGFSYDNMGRLIGTTTQYSFLPGVTLTNMYHYDAASRRTSVTTADGGTNTYQYDTLSRLTDLTNSWAGHFTFDYDNLNRRTSLSRPNSVNTEYSYDSMSRLLSVLHKAGATTIDGASYTNDNAGNRTAKTNHINNTAEEYAYDAIYQLTQVKRDGAVVESYDYDPAGNRLDSFGVPSYTHNVSNQLTATSALAFTYDNNGNTQTKTDANGVTTYNWDYENRLTSVITLSDGKTVSFKYDPFGHRIRKTSDAGTSIYGYDRMNIVAEYDGAGVLVARYSQGDGIDEPLALQHGSTLAYYHADGLGSITSLTDGTGSALAAYTYDAFGKQLVSGGNVQNPFGYTARELDQETGLYYYRARYYSAEVGRFSGEDPLRFEIGPNFYTYVSNNPINHIDPSGLKTEVCCRWLRNGVGPISATLTLSPGLRHCYIKITSEGQSHTYGLHREDEKGNKFPGGAVPRADDGTDKGGMCADVSDATPCKEKALSEGYGSSPCSSCGNGYNGVTTNSNYWVSETLRHFGMTPPNFWGGRNSPGYQSGK